MFGTVGFINDVFTTDHAKWKLSLVREGFAFVNPLIPKVIFFAFSEFYVD